MRNRHALQAIVIAAVCAVFAATGIACYVTISAGGATFEPLYRVGLLMGMTAFTLMVLMTAMMARVPLVERAFGHDEILRVHKKTAIVSFALLAAHLALIGAGNPPSGGGPGVTEVLAVLATLTIIVVTVTSIGKMRMTSARIDAKLDAAEAAVVPSITSGITPSITSGRKARPSRRYELWHWVHLATYFAIGLSLPHIVTLGAAGAPNWVRVYWYGLGISSLVLAFVFRFFVPTLNSRRYSLRVVEVIPHGDDAATIVMNGQNLGSWQAGMFGFWRFHDGLGSSYSHPFSISNAPTDSSLTITVKAVGDGSARAIAVPVGTKVSVEGPYGVMTLQNTAANLPLLFIGSGSGMGPLKSLVESSGATGRAPVVIQRFSGRGEALLSSELQAAVARQNGTYILLPGHRRSADSWAPEGVDDGLNDAQLLQDLVPDIANREIFICGPVKWAESVKSAARAAGVTRKRLHTEAFTS